MFKVLLILDKFFVKYEGGGLNWPPPSQEKLNSKCPVQKESSFDIRATATEWINHIQKIMFEFIITHMTET